ncbi:MAG TPA: protein kinase [Pyrinomonadaceae bacterium]|nr:protein kinase [Pyrinomonadaceae bacterium]
MCKNSFDDALTFCPRDGEVLQQSPDAMVGRVIDGKYEVEGFIAQGGMGAVYRARHILLGDRVVIKTLRPEMRANAEWLKRFQREGRAARAFRHPNSVTVYDLSAGADGLIYMVMEYVEGHTLARELKLRGRFTPSEALGVLEPVADVLDAAHARGVVHRDLKPENVMLGRGGRGEAVVKVLDLGIAKLVGAGDAYATGATPLTTAGQILGTPYYMSPEQWGELPRDGRAEVDGRTDVYSLGLIFCELVAGRKPVSGRTLAELRRQHVAAPPPALEEAVPGVPAGFGRAVARALAKDRADRQQTAGELIDELRASLGLQPKARPHERAPAAGFGVGLMTRPTADESEPETAPAAQPAGALDLSPAERLQTDGPDSPTEEAGRGTDDSDARDTREGTPAPPAPRRTLAPLVAGGALALLLLAAVAGWLAWRRAGQSVEVTPAAAERAAESPPPAAPAARAAAQGVEPTSSKAEALSPKVEAMSYWVETFDGAADETGERLAEVPAPVSERHNFRLHFAARERGYLYLVGPYEEGNALVTMLTARGGRGLKSNLLMGEADFPYPSGATRMALSGDAGTTEGYTVIFSPTPLLSPAFLAEPYMRVLSPAEVKELEDLRARHKADAPALEVRGEGGARRVGVFVTEAAAASGAPVIFDIRIKHL